MEGPQTCGQGLAQRSALPGRLSELTAAIADVLEGHQQSLDLTDDHAREEHAANRIVIGDFRNLTSQLRATAERMSGYRELAMARHRQDAAAAAAMGNPLVALINSERQVLAILEKWLAEDESILAAIRGGDA